MRNCYSYSDSDKTLGSMTLRLKSKPAKSPKSAKTAASPKASLVKKATVKASAKPSPKAGATEARPGLNVKLSRKLESVRKALLERREKLAADLRQATADFISDEEMYADSVDQAAADVDKTITLRMKNRDHTILAQLDEAIRRIDAGNYGDCESCAEPISEPRLKAFPLTTLCIACKAELESEEQRFSTHRG